MLKLISAFILAVMAAGHSAPARALEDHELYKATAFVTGTEEPERSRGFGDGLRLVVAKLGGDAELATLPRLDPYASRAAEFVASFEYEDRMKGIPVHDEQGTRERPHFLFITFDRPRVDALLATLGVKKWPVPRPRLAVLLVIDVPAGAGVLTETGEAGYGQREVLKSVSDKRGVPIVLPSETRKPEVGDIRTGDAGKLAAFVKAAGANCPLWGMLALDARGIYWDMQWTLNCRGIAESWSLSGVTFDTALASGLERSARLLSSAR